MKNALNDEDKFSKLEKDPKDQIKKIKQKVCDYGAENLLTPEEVFAITGVTKKGGMSHSHEFVLKKPHMYLLFKIHKLSSDEIQQRVIPPSRMVTSGVGGPTFRLGTFLDALLKPVVKEYCAGEVLRDSTEFLMELRGMEKCGMTKNLKLIGSMDVNALYPNIRLDIALQALRDALDTVTNFSEAQKDMIVELAKVCIENSVIHYRGSWYLSILGLPTGGPESGSIANIVVYFVLERILLPHPSIAPLNKMTSRKRFLDDLWFGWRGNVDEFHLFKCELNKIGDKNGITFTGEVGRSIDFLDVTVSLDNSHFTTKMFVKPTDASRYLHRRSDHARHTFRSIPFTQFRRATVLCSEESDRNRSIEYITEKLRNSGYHNDEISEAKKRAEDLDREKILSTSNPVIKHTQNTDKVLTFTINRNDFMRKKVAEVLHENKHDIEELCGGPTRLIVAERKNNNTASLVFGKSAFSKCLIEENVNQKCSEVKSENQNKKKKKNGCKSCDLMEIDKTVTLWKNNSLREVNVKLDFRYNCKSENIIYLYICKLCQDNDSFYVGQTTNSCRGRANGHRGKFTLEAYQKSALSFHLHDEHPEHFDGKLSSYSLGILKSTSPMNLDRAEDFFVEITQANLSLNRYKVTSY